MADFAYGLVYNTNYVITSNTLYEIGRNYRFNTSLYCQVQLPVSTWTQVSCGYYHTAGIQTPGTLWTWGLNTFGQLGLNTTIYATTSTTTPVQVGASSLWTNITGGFQHTLAIQSPGTLWAWGLNSYGQLGTSNQTNYSSPVQIGAVNIWTSVSTGQFHTAALQTPGTLWSWGYNSVGELGTSDTVNRSSPVQIGALSTWTSIAVGNSYTMAIQTPGTLWAWGFNTSGQLGLSDTVNRSSPVQVGALSTWTSVAAGNAYTLAIQTPGTLWSWGNNANGQLGSSNTTNRSSPVQVGSLSTWSSVACGYNNSLGTIGGTVYGWGNNGSGQLGLNTTTNFSSPIQVSAPVSVSTLSTRISGGYYHTVVNQSIGALWTAGTNSFGQLGYDTTSYRSYAQQVGALSTWTGFASGSQNTSWAAVINSNGQLYTFGVNSNRLQNYNYNYIDTNDTIQNCAIIVTPVAWDATSGKTVIAASFGDQFGQVIKSDNTLWGWGASTYGQAGQAFGSVPTRTFFSNWASISIGQGFSVGILSNGTLWSWGYNNVGQLGLNSSTSNFSSPIQVGTANTWIAASAGASHTVAIQSPGTLWAWGLNGNGQLGTSNNQQYSSPVQAGAVSIWTSVAAGFNHTAAIQSPGTLWTWGSNSYGQLGINSFSVNVYSPVQVGASTTWTRVVCGSLFTLALQAPGTLWAWGYNNVGQLGLSDVTNRSSPVQVGTLSTWIQVSASGLSGAGIQTPGTLFTWGSNNYGGNLGLNTSNAYYSSPVQVGALSTWTQIACGYTMMTAIQTPGTLWSWGLNTYGSLGNNSTVSFSSPIQVGSLSNWLSVAAGEFINSNMAAALQSTGILSLWGLNSYGALGSQGIISPIQILPGSGWASVGCGINFTLAVQTNGSLWAWGNNSYGQLGTNDQTHRYSPIQVGSVSNWSRVACGYAHVAALQSNGTLWAWGSNSYGQLGQGSNTLGNLTGISSPVQVGTISRYITVYAMNYTTLAETS